MKKLTHILEQADKANLISKVLSRDPHLKILKNRDYIGSDKAHYCERNSLKHKNKYDVYIGYIITYSPSYEKEVIIAHTFNVKNNEVYEFTDLELNRFNLNWNNVTYIGKKVPKEYLKNIETLLNFSYEAYVKFKK